VIRATIHSRGQYPTRALIVAALPQPRKVLRREAEDKPVFDHALKWRRD
jgi:hypothetical protein